jgi:large subunit ribosomal protein L5
MNVMQTIGIEKVTLNVGCGKDQKLLDKAVKLLKNITGINPVKTLTQKRIPEWSLRPGLAIGTKITLRKKKATDLLIKLLNAKDNVLQDSHFNESGNVSFGIHEYIDIKDVKYDPEIGIIGLQVSITLKKPGFRIKKRKRQTKKIPKKHSISKEDAINFMKKQFNIKIGEEE